MFSRQTTVNADVLNSDPRPEAPYVLASSRELERSLPGTEKCSAAVIAPAGGAPDDAAVAGRAATPRVAPTEVLLVTVVALTIYTTLLLRLPYRSPVTNSIYSVLALSSFYFYLRLRLRIRPPALVLLCLVLSIVLDVVGNQFGLFSRRILLVPYDTITHFTSSALSFIPVMWLLVSLLNRFGFRLPLGFVTFFSATTTFSLAAYYEITELIDERVFGGKRIWTPRDTVQDLAADLSGIVVAAVCCALVLRRRRRPV